jgi:hypothetical protein
MVKGAPNYKQIVDKVIRPDLYATTMKDLGVKVPAIDMAPAKLADGVFDPKDPEKYAKGFAIHSRVEA